MKIAFCSQMGFVGQISRNHRNMRVEFAQMCALGATHFPLYSLGTDEMDKDYDHIILLIPKTQQDRDRLFEMDLVELARQHGKMIWFMQEGPNWIFQDLPIYQQFWHFNLLQKVDGILTENVTDISYFRGLLGTEKPIHDIPSLMIEDDIVSRSEWGNAVIIGGNMVRWYGGFDSYIIASSFLPEYSLACVSMGRKQKQEDEIDDVEYLPYMEWRDWINALSQFHVGVHLMPTIAAGTFAMNCAYHGIPVIGYEEADTQRNCHPLTSVKIGDLELAREYAEKLKSDKFYNLCSETAQKRYRDHHSEEAFLKHMNEVLK